MHEQQHGGIPYDLIIDSTPTESDEKTHPLFAEQDPGVHAIHITTHQHGQTTKPFHSGDRTHHDLIKHEVKQLSQQSRFNYRPFNRWHHSWGWCVGSALPAAFTGGMIGYLTAQGLNYFTGVFNHLFYPDPSAGQDASNYDFITNLSWVSYVVLCLIGMGAGYLIRYEIDEKEYVKAYSQFTTTMEIDCNFENHHPESLLQELINHSMFLLGSKHGATALGHLVANINATFFATKEVPIFAASARFDIDEDKEGVPGLTSVEIQSDSDDELLSRSAARIQMLSIGEPQFETVTVKRQIGQLRDRVHRLRGGVGDDFINRLNSIVHDIAQLLTTLDQIKSTPETQDDIKQLQAEITQLQTALSLDKLHFMSVWVFAIRQHMSNATVNTPVKARAQFLQAILSDPFFISHNDDGEPMLTNPFALGEIMYAFFDYCRATLKQVDPRLNEEKEPANPAIQHFKREQQLDVETFRLLNKTHQALIVEAVHRFTDKLSHEHTLIKDSRLWQDLLKINREPKPQPGLLSRVAGFFSRSNDDEDKSSYTLFTEPGHRKTT